MTAVTDNPAARRFELEEAGALAFADYVEREGKLVISHVEAAPGLRGTGAASRLMAGVVEIAKARGVEIAPLCSYAAAWMRRHPQG